MSAIRPSFFIIGAPKAATTSLASLLRYHPEAGIVHGKECNFFSYDQCYAMGWEGYLRLYVECANKRVLGDASTSYSRIRYHPQTIARIHHHVPDAKIIYMVRHPLQRIESAYIEHLCNPAFKDLTSVNEAVRRLPMTVDSSRYWEVFNAYRQKFDESKIKIIWFEEYIPNRIEHFHDVCRFLGIDDTYVPDLGREMTNSRQQNFGRMEQLGRSPSNINTNWDPEIRKRVIDQIRDDNCKFLDHFGRPRNYWGDLF
jgi:hypothetical protein